jgi:GAF domain-containing protein
MLSSPAASAISQAEKRARELLTRGAPLRSVLAPLAGVVEQVAADGSVASILVLDRDGLLRDGASPSLPPDYLEQIDRLRPDANVGTCAAAAATGEIVLTPDFQDDGKWSELRHLPMAIGFRGAWSMPIKSSDGQVVGTFGTYFRKCRLPTEAEKQVVAALVPLAAEFIAAHGDA